MTKPLWRSTVQAVTQQVRGRGPWAPHCCFLPLGAQQMTLRARAGSADSYVLGGLPASPHSSHFSECFWVGSGS